MIKKLPRGALWVMGILLFLSVFRDVLANGRPLHCRINGVSYYPGLRSMFFRENDLYEAVPLRQLQQQVNQFEVWKNPANFDSPPLYAPIPFSPGEHSTLEILPFAQPGSAHRSMGNRFVHWLGTDSEGRDVAATIVSGARIAVLTGALAMAVSFVIGLSLGMIAGFFGDDRLKVKRGNIVLFLIGLPIAWFFAFTIRSYALLVADSAVELWISVGIFIVILFVINALGWFFRRNIWFSHTIVFPADLLIMRVSEIFSALPKLILVIVLAVALRGITGESLWLMIALIGALSWTGVAKLVRAELLRIRALDYVAAARSVGMSEWRILLRHALPNSLRPVYIAFAFGAGGAVLLEAYLSFLGFGGASFRGISWGSLFIIENSKANPLETWWVTLFPGIMIFLTVLSLNRIGERLSA
jgi:peptide/nickel transport system permease protein